MSTKPGVTWAPSRVDLAPAAVVDRPDRGDAVAVDRHVAGGRRPARTVDDRPTPDHEIMHLYGSLAAPSVARLVRTPAPYRPNRMMRRAAPRASLDVMRGRLRLVGEVIAERREARRELRAEAAGNGSVKDRHRVVVVGGGFGGLPACRFLGGLPVDVTLIDRRNHHLFQPLLYQVSTGIISQGQVAIPLRHVLRKHKHVQVELAEVQGFDLDRKVVKVRRAVGGAVEYEVPVRQSDRRRRLRAVVLRT